MSRNPHATNLRHHRQQIIADKRERAQFHADTERVIEAVVDQAVGRAYRKRGG